MPCIHIKKKISPRRCLYDYCQKWLFTSQLVTSDALCGQSQRLPRRLPTSPGTTILVWLFSADVVTQPKGWNDLNIQIVETVYALTRGTLRKCLPHIWQRRKQRGHQLQGTKQSGIVSSPNLYSLHFSPWHPRPLSLFPLPICPSKTAATEQKY